MKHWDRYDWRKYRAVKQGLLCACGNEAVTFTGNEGVCARCRTLQTQAAAFATRREFIGHRAPQGFARGGFEEYKFVTDIVEAGRELIVRGHGEYHLQMGGRA